MQPALSSGGASWHRSVNDGNGFVFIDHVGNICQSGFLPPPHGNIRCLSDAKLIYEPLWADVCDGKQEIAFRGSVTFPGGSSSWNGEAPPGWPCDENGQFIPTVGYTPL